MQKVNRARCRCWGPSDPHPEVSPAESGQARAAWAPPVAIGRPRGRGGGRPHQTPHQCLRTSANACLPRLWRVAGTRLSPGRPLSFSWSCPPHSHPGLDPRALTPQRASCTSPSQSIPQEPNLRHIRNLNV